MANKLSDICATVDGEQSASRGRIVHETRCRHFLWVDLLVLLLYVICLCLLSSKIQEISCHYLHKLPLFSFVKAKSSTWLLKIGSSGLNELKSEQVYSKIVQHAIAINQFTAAYSIEFSAEPRRCNRPQENVCSENNISVTYVQFTSWSTAALRSPCITTSGFQQNITGYRYVYDTFWIQTYHSWPWI